MRRVCSGLFAAAAIAVLAGYATLGAQAAATPYKLGMFQQGTRSFAGLVLDDAIVVDLSRANVQAPATVEGIIAGWDAGLAGRLAKLAADTKAKPPANALKVAALKSLPPIPNPGAMLNAGRNYEDHAIEMAASGYLASGSSLNIDEKVKQGLPGLWTRPPNDPRDNPYMFIKLKSAITGNGDPIILPPGRPMIDWECELVAIIGKKARRVSVDQAMDYVWGYTQENDVSDRQERPDARYGSDWLGGKSQDTFAPMGPFVVPKEFVGDPQKLGLKFSLNGEVMQDSNTNLMTHPVKELLAYGSMMVTLSPNDMISTGTPAGVGQARKPQVWLKNGDTATCTIEKIGTLTNPVQALKPATTSQQ